MTHFMEGYTGNHTKNDIRRYKRDLVRAQKPKHTTLKEWKYRYDLKNNRKVVAKISRAIDELQLAYLKLKKMIASAQ